MFTFSRIAATAMIAAMVVAAAPAKADRRVGSVTDDVTAAECGACHMAFQPRLAVAQTWKRIMADLTNHFGEDASLDEDTRAHIEAYLIDRAWDAPLFGGVPDSLEPGAREEPLRITKYNWFAGKHARFRKSGKSVSNCIRCHPAAENGYFDD